MSFYKFSALHCNEGRYNFLQKQNKSFKKFLQNRNLIKTSMSLNGRKTVDQFMKIMVFKFLQWKLELKRNPFEKICCNSLSSS